MGNKRIYFRPVLHAALLAFLVTTANADGAKTVLFSTASKPLVFSAPAHVVSLNTANIGALLDGVVDSVPVLEGQIVASGRVLVTFNCARRKLDLKQAKLNVQRAQITATAAVRAQARDAELAKRKTISATLYQSAIKAAELALIDRGLKEIIRDRALKRVENCQITAPFRGQVTKINIAKGSYVATGATVLTLLQSEALEVIAALSSEELEQAQQAKRLVFKAAEKDVVAQIRAVDRLQDRVSGLQRVHLTVETPARLVAGMQGQLQWAAEFRQLPARFLVHRNKAVGVMIVRDGKAVFHPVPGAIDGLPIRLELRPGTRIILP